MDAIIWDESGGDTFCRTCGGCGHASLMSTGHRSRSKVKVKGQGNEINTSVYCSGLGCWLKSGRWLKAQNWCVDSRKRLKSNKNTTVTATAIKSWFASCLTFASHHSVVNKSDDECYQQIPTVAFCWQHRTNAQGKGLDTCYSATYFESDPTWPAALYNIGSGSWLAWANGAAAHYVAIHCPR